VPVGSRWRSGPVYCWLWRRPPPLVPPPPSTMGPPRMAHSYRALCSDFYLNMKLAMKLELPRERQPLLDLFDRMRRQFPDLEHVRRYRDELALEAGPDDRGRWIAVRPRDLRAGVVNPDEPDDAL